MELYRLIKRHARQIGVISSERTVTLHSLRKKCFNLTSTAISRIHTELKISSHGDQESLQDEEYCAVSKLRASAQIKKHSLGKPQEIIKKVKLLFPPYRLITHDSDCCMLFSFSKREDEKTSESECATTTIPFSKLGTTLPIITWPACAHSLGAPPIICTAAYNLAPNCMITTVCVYVVPDPHQIRQGCVALGLCTWAHGFYLALSNRIKHEYFVMSHIHMRHTG